MVLEGIQPDQFAEEWANRIGSRMRELKIANDEVEENTRIIRSFCKTAVELLREDPTIKLPYADTPIHLNNQQAHLIIDLFLRGVNQSAKILRMNGKNWDDRKNKLEGMSWKIFNLAKLMVGLKEMPNPAFAGLLSQDKDLKIMMKHSMDELLRKELGVAK